MLTLKALRELLFDPAGQLFGVRMPTRRTERGRRQRAGSVSSLVDVLEDRTLLAHFVVDTLVDEDFGGGDLTAEMGDGMGLSLREAIGLANQNNGGPNSGDADGDTIAFDATLAGGTILIGTLGELAITDDVTIDGAGAPGITIDGQNAVRIFNIAAAGIGAVDLVAITNLTVTTGSTAGSAGDNGGAILITGISEVVQLDNVDVLNSAAITSGGGIFLDGGMLTIEGGMGISNNTAAGAAATDGGGGIYNDGGTLMIDGTMAPVTIAGNAASGAAGSGGGIHSTGGSVTIDSSILLFNEAVRAGGGIEVTGGGTLMLTDTDLFTNDVSSDNLLGLGLGAMPGNGGGIHVTGGGVSVQISGGTISGNRAAEEGGGLWNDAGSMMAIDSVAGAVSINNNRASGPAADQGGGGIFNNGGTLTIDGTNNGVAISSNLAFGASGSGGGLFSTDGMVTIHSATISTNEALRAGGGIEIVNGTVSLTDSLLDGNDVSDSAGLLLTANPGNGGGLHITGNGANVTLTNTMVSNNAADNEGGGLWNAAGSTLIVRSGSVIDGNTASGIGGGGLFNNGGPVTITDATITNNMADGIGPGSGGGGIFNSVSGVMTINDSTIQINSAGLVGGGIENNAGTVVINNSFVDFNRAGTNGAAVHTSGAGRVEFDSSSALVNIAGEEGGGLWNSSTGVLIVRNSSFIGDNAAAGNMADQGGGGIFNDGGRLAIHSGVTLLFNQTLGSGGGILSVNGVVTIDDSVVRGNLANRAGGGIEMITGVVELRNTELRENQALGSGSGSGNGGGLHVTGQMGQVGFVRIFGGIVFENTAASEGGGLWNQAGNIMVVRQGAIIDGNTASGDLADDGGGGIFNNNGRLVIAEAARITRNSANGLSGSGGGIFSMGGGVTIEGDSLIAANTANRAGGGIEVVNGVVEVIDSTIGNNHATGGGTGPGNGGGIHVTGTNFTRVDLRNSLVTINTAAREGGGLWNQTNGVMFVRAGTQVTGNTASGSTGGGGGIFNKGGRLIINAATIDDNSANGTFGRGGGLLTEGGVVTIESSTLSNNVAHASGGGINMVFGILSTLNMNLIDNDAGGAAPAPGDGGGLFVEPFASGAGGSASPRRVTVSGGSISGNTAANQGGGLWNSHDSIVVIKDGTTIHGNTASGDGGGGIFNNTGRLAITRATISGNVADGTDGAGGGILSLSGGVTLDNSTVSGNMADGNGGGILSNGELITANATIAANTADADALGGGTGGGLFNGGVATLKNTIVAGNVVAVAVNNDLAGNNVQGTSPNNLISDAASAGGLVNGVSGNIIGVGGVGVIPLATILDPLAGNGGPTLTHALALGSPAIDAGSNFFAKDVNGIAFTTDQRGFGFPRIKNGIVDIGAFEN